MKDDGAATVEPGVMVPLLLCGVQEGFCKDAGAGVDWGVGTVSVRWEGAKGYPCWKSVAPSI